MNKTEAINCIQDIIDVANSHGSACVYSRNGGTAQLENVLECLKNSEPVVHDVRDSESEVHAHWIKTMYNRDTQEKRYRCSYCDIEISVKRGELGWFIPYICDCCGAVMDEEDSENG